MSYPKRRRIQEDAALTQQEELQSPSDDNDDTNNDLEDNDVDDTLDARDVYVNKLVRFALACEYARQPIRRSDIGLKVFNDIGGGQTAGGAATGTAGSGRSFKAVFQRAQRQLSEVFGMRMVELPVREKVTVSQRRAAQKADRTSTTSNSWVLTTTLPPSYRTPTLIPPPRAPTVESEATYTALYTLLISLITLSGGVLSEQKLERYLRRMGAETHTPIERTERVVARMLREGYLVRNRSVESGEEVVEYIVGPRGKVEVGGRGVAGLVGVVYGFGADVLEKREEVEDGEGEGEGAAREGRGGHGEKEVAEFQKKLRRSLGLGADESIVDPADLAAANAEVEVKDDKSQTQTQTQRRSTRRVNVSARDMEDRDGNEEEEEEYEEE